MWKPLLLAALSLLAPYLYTKLRYKRFQQFASLPQLPASLILGHLKLLGEYMKQGPGDRHPDMMFAAMHQDLGKPPLMFVDLRPVNRPMIMITSHEVAEQVSRSSKAHPTSVPKADLRYLEPLTGSASILASHGDDWKALRKRFSPGFAPQHLMTLLPSILNKIPAFVEHLDGFASSGEDFPLAKLLMNLTFDVIGSVVMDEDLQSQHKDPLQQGELIQLYSELLSTYWDDKADAPWWLIPGVIMKRNRLGKRVDDLLKAIIRRKHAEQLDGVATDHARSILSLSLKDAETLSPELVDVTCDQLKTFLLAGHDTTSTLLAWLFYELSRTPRVLKTLREELDSLFGPGTGSEGVTQQLLSPNGPELVRRMTYISLVIKETLRLHAPAATARYTKPGTGFTIRTPSGEEHCLDGTIIYNCEKIINTDPAVYGDSAEAFVPERWLDDADETSSKIPASAFRSFERGPRDCIGREFALIEARVIVAVVARRFDFTKVGKGELELDEKHQPILGDFGQYKTQSLLYKSRQITSKPVDGMMVKVKVI